MSRRTSLCAQLRNATNIRILGTTCAAWDQMPGTPWAHYCPQSADWCHSSYNWCQLPWCFVGEGCGSKLSLPEFAGSAAAYYSYDTCLSTPDCRNMPFDAACPFEPTDTGWATAADCSNGWSEICTCQFQGTTLPSDIYMNYPLNDPGKFAKLASIAVYGTTCAAWDRIPETPMASTCASSSDWSSATVNWCQVPWCYVSESCVSAARSEVFNGSSLLHYSYDACGNAPDCYNSFASDPRCPYDPTGDGTFVVHKGAGCECLFYGTALPSDVYLSFPAEDPGRYANMSFIHILGTTCAAWDQMPGTPWAHYCPQSADWCHSSYNWCQLPWCFVGEGCGSKLSLPEFAGSAAAYYSYDTCLSTPDCRNMPFDAACPFEPTDTGWATAADCSNGWSEICTCQFQGATLPSDIYMNYPLNDPGKFAKLASIAVYGTTCAAWDRIPETPMASTCASSSDWSSATVNWCQVPWCYVSESCVSAVRSEVFNGSSLLHYSYDACGNAPDCYNSFASDPRCPYDPTGDGTFVVHKGAGCECLFYGTALPSDVYLSFPAEDPGRYANMSFIHILGTTCAAWDQMPGTPWAHYCPQSADWCHSSYNWCQLPWCFVGEGCSSKLSLPEFAGSAAAYYSYDTCLSTPDCRNMPFDAACPFEPTDTGWATATECPNSWTDVCECLYQGSLLPAELYTQFPSQEPGKYAALPNIAIYGTACAAWDQVPGTPWSHSCAPGSDWSSSAFNWCQLPWCYVSSECASRIPTLVFNGSIQYFSYDSCGNAPDCYNDFSQDKRCPYDPYGTHNYKLHKGDDCECSFHGLELPFTWTGLNGTDDSDDGEFPESQGIYGTTCAAWDQMPGMPWSQYCPTDADWCDSQTNWCQLPWCYVAELCSSKIASSMFAARLESYYSYDTCLSTPDCRNMPFDAACPFEPTDTGWATATECPNSWTDVCECLYQGSLLPAELYTQFPSQEPGRYAALPNIAIYGTACAAWDQVPGTPWSHSCAPGSDWSSSAFNWCQLPWCYVSSECASRIPTLVFNGSIQYFSYDSCGNAPDCYNDFSQDKRCPYDPYGTHSYNLHKGDDCECSFHGLQLTADVYSLYPLTEPGKYANLSHINTYGTTCAAWDQMPGMPWQQYCSPDADWCHSQTNWCQLPWCYVAESCSSRIASNMFQGSVAAYYSYDTCLSTPDCRNMPFDAACPFEPTDTGWATATECPNSWTDVCECLYKGVLLPAGLYTHFPSQEPGKYAALPNIAIYGTACAAWDQVPGTPWSHSCAPGSDWSSSAFNWCQLPWCYVSSECASRIPTLVFNGSIQYFSYDSCGNAPDCYNDFSQDKRCPYDPYGTHNFTVHKGDDCECSFHGLQLPADVYSLYPLTEPGKYANLSHINTYGTTCAAWDQMPGMPWQQYCPADADWCHSQTNWCQLPWCYVAESCSSKIASNMFQGSVAAYYSYDTCLSTPDCRNMPFDAACPFEPTDTGWATATECPNSWTDVCECLYQGSLLPAELYTQFPSQEPGRYAALPNIAIYGTACAAWDQVPGTPWSHSCAPGSDWSSSAFNWCQLPWCYVSSECASRIPTLVFNGSIQYFSYDSCGNAPDCYNDFSQDKRCPYDPYGTHNYKVHKGDDCECSFHGLQLPADVYSLYPLTEPGKYANLSHINTYGTTCAAWDQMPGMPWSQYCPTDADWCNSESNWCQLPWCYVSRTCNSAIMSSVFAGNGSSAVFYSYDTCLSTPDCFSQQFNMACPFDWTNSGWSTPQHCPESWSDVCKCIYQGQVLPPELYTMFPVDFPGKNKHFPNIDA